MNVVSQVQATPREPIRAAWLRYAAIASLLGLLVITVLFVIWPWLHGMVIQRLVLPGYEKEFGFHGGMIRPSDTDYSVYGIASVVPGGRLERAGVRAGDIPAAYGGGMWDFYYALTEASEGREGTFSVVTTLQEYRDRKMRQITVSPKGKAQ